MRRHLGAHSWCWVVLVFCTLGLYAADDVVVSATIVTNTQLGLVTTRQWFTRGGQTNLVHVSHSVNGVVEERLYRFYYEGKHAADCLVKPRSGKSFTDTYNGFELHVAYASNCLTEVMICEKKHRVLDRFTITNGMLAPVAATELVQWFGIPTGAKSELQKEVGK